MEQPGISFQTPLPSDSKKGLLFKFLALLSGGAILILLGGFIGWQTGQKQNLSQQSKPSSTEENANSASFKQLEQKCKEQIVYQNYIIDPKIKWPGLITSGNLNYQLGGIITAKEKGTRDNRSITVLKISAHTDKSISIPIYAYDDVEYKVFEGADLNNPNNLKSSSLGKFNVGDSVYIDASTPTFNSPELISRIMADDTLDLQGRYFFKFLK